MAKKSFVGFLIQSGIKNAGNRSDKLLKKHKKGAGKIPAIAKKAGITGIRASGQIYDFWQSRQSIYAEPLIQFRNPFKKK